MGKTAIEWADETWPITRGCTRVSAGCQHCYAEAQAARIVRMGKGAPTKYDGLVKLVTRDVRQFKLVDGQPTGDFRTVQRTEPRWTGTARFCPEELATPLRQRKGRRIFVSSMSDLFHDDITNEQLAAVFGVMAACPQHVFMVLTKRARRMREWFAWVSAQRLGGELMRPTAVSNQAVYRFMPGDNGEHEMYRRAAWLQTPCPWPLPNVMLGVSVENQDAAVERIPYLQRTPAALHWISAEPLLGPIDLTPWIGGLLVENQEGGGVCIPSSDIRGTGDRLGRSSLAHRHQTGESLGRSVQTGTMQPQAGGPDRVRGLPVAQRDARREVHDGVGAPSRVEALQWSDSERVDDQPQERREVGQQTVEPRTGHRLGANAPRDARTRNRESGEPARGEKSVHEADRRTGSGDQGGATEGRETDNDRCPIRRDVSARVGGGPRSQSLHLIISGCESGPGARPCEVAWYRSLRDQCAAAGVAFFLKQAREINDPAWHGGVLHQTIGVGFGSHRKPGGVIGAPYLDGVQHLEMPAVRRG